MPLHVLWQTWRHEDTGYYINIALHGYTDNWRTAFFPFYAILEYLLTLLTHDPLIAGLLISNLATLILFVVLYQLVYEDFDHELAQRTVLYLALFPTAFFLIAAYNESLFISLALLSFYEMRHGRWWLAGLFGLFASLTRSTGLFLLVPFAYEYLRQHQFYFHQRRVPSLDILSMLLIPAGTGIFAIYCYLRFGDLLAFSHAQAHWGHQFHLPWYAIKTSLSSIRHSSGLLGFQALRNLTDLVPDLLVMLLLILSLLGPCRLPRSHWSYLLYAGTLFLFLQCFPINWDALPLQSLARYMLEIFPAFITLAMLGKYRLLHLSYLLIAGATLFFLLTQFLTAHWVV